MPLRINQVLTVARGCDKAVEGASMRATHSIGWISLTLAIASISVTAAADEPVPLAAGSTFKVGGQQATVTRLEFLPLVENDYSRRFRFDRFDNPKLKQLREREKLDEVVAPGRDEFERQVLLLDWVNHRFKKFGTPSAQPHGAAEILRDIDAGHTFFCAHYADVLVSAAASLGWVDRSLALRRPANVGSGSSEHSSTEIWSNQWGKWVMFDPTFAMYVEAEGRPLNAFELRDEWFYRDGTRLTFVLDKDRKRYTKADLPVLRQRYAGFGDLALDPSALIVYAFIGYVPNTNLLDAGPDYGKMFITQDKLCEGTAWHKRDVPAQPAVEPYFSIGQAALTVVPTAGGVRVSMRTLTPNFKSFRSRFDDDRWQTTGDSFEWPLHAGTNRLETRTVNAFDVEGPVSTVEIAVKSDAK
jgi:hypothetical protein